MEPDKRFAHIATDPKFRRIPKGERKVKIDKRFKSMLTDQRFQVKYTVDKRGRPVNHSTSEDLRRYYDLDSSEEDGNQDEDDSLKIEANKTDLSRTDTSDKQVTDKVRTKLKNLQVDYARGEGNLLSESSSDDGEESEEDEDKAEAIEEGIDHKWGELDADAERTEEVTHRLAACNMDWDRIRAEDLFVLFSSFLPPGGSIKSITIYQSEFGRKRMAEEEIKGPAELVTNDDENDGNADGSKYHMERLRMYQLNRLKYYYALVDCDSAKTAFKLYSECDGMEYESSSTKIDLRFVPDHLTFDGDVTKESCLALPEGKKYKPRFFTTTALQQAKVDLTWDETNPERIELTKKLSSGKVDDVYDADIQAYLASSSEEEEEEIKNEDDLKSTTEKYKLLVQKIEEKENEKKNKEIGMEISWGVDLQKKTDKMMKDKQSGMENQTPFEQYLAKRKEKRKEKRAAKNALKNDASASDSDVPDGVDMNDSYFAEEFNNPEFENPKKPSKNKKKAEENEEDFKTEDGTDNLEQLKVLLDDGDDEKKHFSLKKIQARENVTKSKKKRMKKKGVKLVDDADDFAINVNDDRFSALYTSHLYNIDPTDPHYRKTKNMEKLIDDVIKKRAAADMRPEKSTKKAKFDEQSKSKSTELNVLVKSVKRKSETFKK